MTKVPIGLASSRSVTWPASRREISKQIVDESGQIDGFTFHRFDIPADGFRVGRHAIGNCFDHHPNRCEWGAEVMGNRCDQPLARLLEFPLTVEGCLQSTSHCVERSREFDNLTFAGFRNADGEVAGGQQYVELLLVALGSVASPRRPVRWR